MESRKHLLHRRKFLSILASIVILVVLTGIYTNNPHTTTTTTAISSSLFFATEEEFFVRQQQNDNNNNRYLLNGHYHGTKHNNHIIPNNNHHHQHHHHHNGNNRNNKPSPWYKVTLTEAAQTNGAVCLDGSPGVYYIRKPLVGRSGEEEAQQHHHNNNSDEMTSSSSMFPTIDPGSNNGWLIFHQGGGWCSSHADCLYRSQRTMSGSSLQYPDPQQQNTNTNHPSIIAHESTSDSLFRLFPTFTIVFAPYCDGTSWTGDVDDPVEVIVPGGQQKENQGGKVYYRGGRLFHALFDDLLHGHDTWSLNDADLVIYGGESAGAMTSMLHIDHVRTLLQPHVTLLGMADSMLSFPTNVYNTMQTDPLGTYLKWGYTAWNSVGHINTNCVTQLGWECFFGTNIIRYVQTPMFVASSKYDIWLSQIYLPNKPYCSGTQTQDGKVQLCQNHPLLTKEIQFWYQKGRQTVELSQQLIPAHHAVFLTNCPWHCLARKMSLSSNDGMYYGNALREWLMMAIGKEPRFRGLMNDEDGKWKEFRWYPSDDVTCLPLDDEEEKKEEVGLRIIERGESDVTLVE